MFILFIAFDEGERIVFPGDLKCPAVIDRGRCHMISGFERHLGVAACLAGWLAAWHKWPRSHVRLFWPPGTGNGELRVKSTNQRSCSHS